VAFSWESSLLKEEVPMLFCVLGSKK